MQRAVAATAVAVAAATPPPVLAGDAASSLCGGAASAVAPPQSALRRGKYSSIPYARSDIVGGGGVALRSVGVTDKERCELRYSARPTGDAACCSSGWSARPSACACGGGGGGGGGPAATSSVCLPLLRPAGTVGAHGPILSRTSPRSLLMRRWRSAYWAHVHPARLVVFRSREDFDEWASGATKGGKDDDGAKVQQQRAGLIKWSVDFDTLGVLRKKEKKLRKEQRRREKEERRKLDAANGTKKDKKKKKKKRDKHFHAHDDDDHEDPSIVESTVAAGGESVAGSTRAGGTEKKKKSGREKKKMKGEKEETKPPTPVVHSVANSVLKYSMQDVHSKTYGRHSPVLHSFKLERWTRNGTGVAAAFASSDPGETRALRKAIRELIWACAKDRKGGGGDGAADWCDVGSVATATASLSGPSSFGSGAGSRRGTATAGSGAAAPSFPSSSGPVEGVTDPSPAVRSHVLAYGDSADAKSDAGSSVTAASSLSRFRRGRRGRRHLGRSQGREDSMKIRACGLLGGSSFPGVRAPIAK